MDAPRSWSLWPVMKVSDMVYWSLMDQSA
jgi:hypothetical protein